MQHAEIKNGRGACVCACVCVCAYMCVDMREACVLCLRENGPSRVGSGGGMG
jgi:hypothetical protein